MQSSTALLLLVVVVVVVLVVVWYAKKHYGAVFSLAEFLSDPIKFLGDK